MALFHFIIIVITIIYYFYYYYYYYIFIELIDAYIDKFFSSNFREHDMQEVKNLEKRIADIRVEIANIKKQGPGKIHSIR